MVWLKPDGSMVDAGYVQVRSDPDSAHEESRFFHADCLAEAGPSNLT